MKYIYIRKIFLSFLFLLLLQAVVTAQTQTDQRTLSTRIADLLAEVPAVDSSQFNRLMMETAALGESGIIAMSQMFTPPGEGDNSKLEYALGGLSFYSMQPNKEDTRMMASNAYSKALDGISDEEIKAFFIRQLQIVGKEEAVRSLEKYLSNERLCGAGARALVQINTPSAQNALLKALANSPNSCQYTMVVALGDMRNKEAVGALTKLAGSNDQTLKKLALHALANIGDPSSESLLAGEAEKAGFTLNESNATASYLLWAKRMAEAGNTKTVEKLARKMLKRLDQDSQVHSRTAFLKLLADNKTDAAMPVLLAAATDKNPEYRAAALKFSTAYPEEKWTAQWIKQMRKADPEAKADIIAMLGDRNDPAAYAAVAQALDSKDSDTKLAAISASAKLGGESALPKLLEMMETADTAEVDAIKTSILSMDAGNMVPKVADALAQTPSYGISCFTPDTRRKESQLAERKSLSPGK